MKSLRKITLFAGILAVLSLAPPHLFAADFFIAQNAAGASSGADCANAYAVAWFNTSANWANPKQTGKVGPGDTAHLCGTISTALTVPISGSPGSPITIYWEPDAKLSAPTLSGNWISATGKSNLTFDGGQNGIIENTNNGTGPANGGTYDYQNVTVGISDANPGGDNITVKNLTIQNLYVRVPESTLDCNGKLTNGAGIYLSGSNIVISNVTVSNVAGGVIFLIPTSGSNLTIDSCTVLAANHFYELAGSSGTTYSNVTISNNVADGMDVWGPSCDAYHRDLIFFHTDGMISNIYIYNNRLGPGFNPSPSSTIAGTAAIYFNGNVNPRGTYNNVYIFNNLALLKSPLAWSGCQAGICIGSLGSAGLIANNTFISGNGLNGFNNSQPGGYSYNNIVYYKTKGSIGPYLSTLSNGTDYNIYYNLKTYGGYDLYNDTTKSYQCMSDSFSQWKTCSGQDSHSALIDPLFVNPSLEADTGNYHLQSTSSPAYHAGRNLSDFVATLDARGDAMAKAAGAALAKDRNGNARPTAGNGNWDIGASQYQESIITISPPSSLRIAQ